MGKRKQDYLKAIKSAKPNIQDITRKTAPIGKHPNTNKKTK